MKVRKFNEDIDRDSMYQREFDIVDNDNGDKMYYAYLKQKGEGCDYTIGCAQVMVTVKANSFDEATEKLELIIKTHYYDDTELEDAMIFEEQPRIIDLDTIYNQRSKDESNRRQQAQEEKDRAELARLMNKYKEQ